MADTQISITISAELLDQLRGVLEQYGEDLDYLFDAYPHTSAEQRRTREFDANALNKVLGLLQLAEKQAREEKEEQQAAPGCIIEHVAFGPTTLEVSYYPSSGSRFAHFFGEMDLDIDNDIRGLRSAARAIAEQCGYTVVSIGVRAALIADNNGHVFLLEYDSPYVTGTLEAVYTDPTEIAVRCALLGMYAVRSHLRETIEADRARLGRGLRLTLTQDEYNKLSQTRAALSCLADECTLAFTNAERTILAQLGDTDE